MDMGQIQNCVITDWPFGQIPPHQTQTIYIPPQGQWYPYWQTSPTFCAGDVHVFPCPHCDKCKCGKATVKRNTVRKDGR